MKKFWVLPLFLLSTQLHAQESAHVSVLEIKGGAEIRLSIDGEWKPLKVGDLIPDGAWIQTALRSLVYLKFWNNTVAQIKSASLIQVKGLSSDGSRMAGRIHLSLGTARVHVDKKKLAAGEKVDFKIVSPKMTTSIKGTISAQSRIGWDRDSSYTQQGSVALSMVGRPLLSAEKESGTIGNSKPGNPVGIKSITNMTMGKNITANSPGGKKVSFKQTSEKSVSQNLKMTMEAKETFQVSIKVQMANEGKTWTAVMDQKKKNAGEKGKEENKPKPKK